MRNLQVQKRLAPEAVDGVLVHSPRFSVDIAADEEGRSGGIDVFATVEDIGAVSIALLLLARFVLRYNGVLPYDVA